MRIECDIHRRMIVMQGFDVTECKICKCKIDTAHTPGDVVCEACSKEKYLCVVCGKKPKYDDNDLNLP